MAFESDFLSMMREPAIYQALISTDGYGASTVQATAAGTNVPAYISYKTVITYGDEEENQASTAQLQIPPPGFIHYAGINYFSNPNARVAIGSGGGNITQIATWVFPAAGQLSLMSAANMPATGTALVTTTTGVATISYTGITGNNLTGCVLLNGNGIVLNGSYVAQNTMPTIATLDQFTLPDGTLRHVLWVVTPFDESGQPHHQSVYLD